MVQVCGGVGVGKRGGRGWREMEFYPWRGAGRGLTGARLADHGKSDGPQCGEGHQGETRQEQGGQCSPL